MAPDLDELQRRINESRDQFLRALAIYEKDGLDDGRAITETYLLRFLGSEPKRSPFAKTFATEAIGLIADFGVNRAKMAEQVNLLNVETSSQTLGITVDVLRDYVENTFPAMDASFADPTARVLNWSKRFHLGIDEQDARQTARVRAVTDIGRRLDAVQRLAASLLLARHATLRMFRRENLDLTIEELRRLIAEQMNEASKDQVLETVVSATWVIIEQSLKVVFEETIIVKIAVVIYKIWGSIRGRVDTAPGAQDAMERLLAVLREQNKGLEDLNRRYESAMEQLGELAKART